MCNNWEGVFGDSCRLPADGGWKPPRLVASHGAAAGPIRWAAALKPTERTSEVFDKSKNPEKNSASEKDLQKVVMEILKQQTNPQAGLSYPTFLKEREYKHEKVPVLC
jgi:hypothetical protein